MFVREALRSMAYVEVKTGHWLKPIGFMCFSFDESKNTWSCWFKSALGKVECWESHLIGHDEKQSGTYTYQIKHWECFTRTGVFVNGTSEFQLGVKDFDGLW